MNPSFRNLRLDWLLPTLQFLRKHLLIVLTLGMIAALGRSAQLRAFGPISTAMHYLLEVAIQSARIGIFVYALGWTNVRIGVKRVVALFTRSAWRQNWRLAKQKIAKDWLSMLSNIVIYLLIAFVINLLIDQTAYETCLYANLKSNSIISSDSSEWTIILFLKNLSVIPFTLVFNALFMLWLTGRIGPDGHFHKG